MRTIRYKINTDITVNYPVILLDNQVIDVPILVDIFGSIEHNTGDYYDPPYTDIDVDTSMTVDDLRKAVHNELPDEIFHSITNLDKLHKVIQDYVNENWYELVDG